jgi:hypothetical protein
MPQLRHRLSGGSSQGARSRGAREMQRLQCCVRRPTRGGSGSAGHSACNQGRTGPIGSTGAAAICAAATCASSTRSAEDRATQIRAAPGGGARCASSCPGAVASGAVDSSPAREHPTASRHAPTTRDTGRLRGGSHDSGSCGYGFSAPGPGTNCPRSFGPFCQGCPSGYSAGPQTCRTLGKRSNRRAASARAVQRRASGQSLSFPGSRAQGAAAGEGPHIRHGRIPSR